MIKLYFFKTKLKLKLVYFWFLEKNENFCKNLRKMDLYGEKVVKKIALKT